MRDHFDQFFLLVLPPLNHKSLLNLLQGILILLTNLFGIIFMEFTWDANVLSVVESMPTQMRASSLGSCSMVARVGGLFAPLVWLYF